MEKQRMCVLDEKKVCDDCGECNRCDLDPNKICDNCCRCIAMEDEGSEFRSRTVSLERSAMKKGTLLLYIKDPRQSAPSPRRSIPKTSPWSLRPSLLIIGKRYS